MFPFHRESLISLTFRTKKPPQKRSGPFPVPNKRTKKKPAQKQSTSKTRCTSVLPRKRFVRPLRGPCTKANGGSSSSPGSIQTTRQVFRLWRPRLRSLPSHAVLHSGIDEPQTPPLRRRSRAGFTPASLFSRPAKRPGHLVSLCCSLRYHTFLPLTSILKILFYSDGGSSIY